MSTNRHAAPIDRLLTYSADVERMRGAWPEYIDELGFTQSDVAGLASLAGDLSLYEADPESTEFWAPVHAWRALAQLGVPDGLECMFARVQHDPDDEWTLDEIPAAAALVGPACLALLSRALAAPEMGEECQSVASEAIAKVALAHESAQAQAIEILTGQLRLYLQNSPVFNGFLVGALIDLQAKDALELIEAAYDADAVYERIVGDVDDVRVAFGLPPRPVSEYDRSLWELAKAQALNELPRGLLREAALAPRPSESPQAKAKAKAKRKAANQSRKANRKK